MPRGVSEIMWYGFQEGSHELGSHFLPTGHPPDVVLRDLRRLAQRYRPEAGEATFLELSIIMKESQEQCPVDTGFLYSKGEVKDPKVSDGMIECELGYYGVDYAVYVHEDLGKYHEPPTKAKFLEDPVNQHIHQLPQNIIARVDKILLEGG